MSNADAWPPDWRVSKADALEAVVIRLGLVLAELDELEALLADDPPTCSAARQLAGRVRTRRDGHRDEIERLRDAAKELAL
jgi:hypothetical protein